MSELGVAEILAIEARFLNQSAPTSSLNEMFNGCGRASLLLSHQV